MYNHGLLSDGQGTHKSTWPKNFHRSRRFSVLSASARLPPASTQMRLTSWRMAGCDISHSLLASTVSQSRRICQYNPPSAHLPDQPSSMNIQCTSTKTTPHSEMHVLRNLDHVYDSRFYLHTIPTHITAVFYCLHLHIVFHPHCLSGDPRITSLSHRPSHILGPLAIPSNINDSSGSI
jgi:hypothetical protein